MGKELFIKDFGAIGDGVSDDAQAITDAIISLHECGPGSTLYFEDNKKYYFGKGFKGLNVVFRVCNTIRASIIGHNTRIITDSPNMYMLIHNNKDFYIEGITFDYKKKPYVVTTQVQNLDIEKGTAEFYISDDLDIPCGIYSKFICNDGGLGFGVIDMPIARWHMFIEGYKKLENKRVKVYFSMDSMPLDEMKKRLNMLNTHRLILPVPHVAHWVNVMCDLWNNNNFILKDVNFVSGSKFMFSICNNDGICIFDKVNIFPENDVDFVCWRDGWHLKENHAKFIWRDCKASGLQDDIFNISSSVMFIKEIINSRTINMFWPETGGAFRRELVPHERIQIINSKNGIILGETEISCVIKQEDSDNIIVLKDMIDGIESGEDYKVIFPDLVANNSVIENGWFDGTTRFRGPIKITGTYFNNRRMWLDILTCNWLEAPIPNNIVFKDCKIDFESEPEDEKFVHLSSYNENVSENSYHINNILFDSCIVDKTKFSVGTGDNVIFRNCKLQNDL